MRTTILTALVSLICLVADAQKELISSRTASHQQVDGTKFFLVPPVGFVKATSFPGFQQLSSAASILVMDIPGPFSENTKGFNEQGLKTQGVVLVNSEELTFNGAQALFLTTEQFAHGVNFTKYIFAFGDSQRTYLVNGMFPKEAIALDSGIRESMLSVVFDPTVVVDPLKSALYGIKTEGSKLRFASSLSGSLIYTVDGKVPTESQDKTSFAVGNSLANVQTVDKKLTALNRMRRLPYDNFELDEDETREVNIDGLSGYEMVGEGDHKSSGKKQLVYQAMLFTDNGYYIMLGTASAEFDLNLRLFRSLAVTFSRK